MPLERHAYAGPADQSAMAALVRNFPDDHLHNTDLPYRFSAWALDEPKNVALWRDSSGQLAAWAVLNTPFWALDYACRPGAAREAHELILAWAAERAGAAFETPFGRPCWFVNVFSDQTERCRDLEQAGWDCVSDVGENAWSKVLMRRVDQPVPSAATLPAGFQLRPLGGQAEVAAYVDLHRAVFESKSMTSAWRARILEHAAYRPELDLVAGAPGGGLAAFCIGWFQAGAAPAGQIEPMGVRADYRHLGLGRAILSEVVHRLLALGAAYVDVETDSYRNAAFELYEAVGFRVIKTVLVYRKDFGPRPPKSDPV